MSNAENTYGLEHAMSQINYRAGTPVWYLDGLELADADARDRNVSISFDIGHDYRAERVRICVTVATNGRFAALDAGERLTPRFAVAAQRGSTTPDRYWYASDVEGAAQLCAWLSTQVAEELPTGVQL